MTKQDLQKELQEKVIEGVKPSDIKKLKRSKSADDISTSLTPNIPLQKSKSQLEIPVSQQPTPEQQITQLQEQVKFHAQTSQNYLKSLQLSQVKIIDLESNLGASQQTSKNLEDQILQLRLDKIKEFGDYLEKKQVLETELEQNITEGINEIKRLENKLIATNKRKLELQQKLGTSESKVAQLELQLINNEEPRSFNYWPLLVFAGCVGLVWIFNQPK